LETKEREAAEGSSRGRDISRLEAFSDAVFGFAATLLVVSLEVPRTYPELLNNLSGFVAFGLSFVALVLIWAGHNAFFRKYGMTDNWTVVLNSLLLFVVLFYVYPLKFMASGMVQGMLGFGAKSEGAVTIQTLDELSSLFAVYGAGFVAVFGCFVLLHVHALRSREDLRLTAEETIELRGTISYYGIYVVVGALSAALALLGIGVRLAVPGWVYGALGPLCWLNGRRVDRQLLSVRGPGASV